MICGAAAIAPAGTTGSSKLTLNYISRRQSIAAASLRGFRRTRHQMNIVGSVRIKLKSIQIRALDRFGSAAQG